MSFKPTVTYTGDRDVFAAFFSDESERFRSPVEPEPGERCTVRLRAPRLPELRAFVQTGGQLIPMERTGGDGRFDLYAAELLCGETTMGYCFRVILRGRQYVYQKNGLHPLTAGMMSDHRFQFRFLPGFHTPAWAQGAVMYQIFPDRFRNGDKSNDVLSREYAYGEYGHVQQIPGWEDPTPPDGYRCFYGGDLAGILEKLDYLQDLGVEAIYLNPIFLSPSSHKYDAQDYEHIDPHLGVIREDGGRLLEQWEQNNALAERYITRVLSKENLALSDELFARLCQELHRRGMRIILDGVFNHCGSFHYWLDREGLYRDRPGFAKGAFQDKKSPYRDYFRFLNKEPGYEAWWGFDTLPKLNYENSPELAERILEIACHWARPPYSIDGWRLDVGADLGHSPEYNHRFWRQFRRRLKELNPQLLILAEHYGDPTAWLLGDQWDSVMNYDAFMDPLSFFLTGIDKHSDTRRDDLYQNGPGFFEAMERNMACYEWGSLHCAMNELSNHDHSRFLTRTNRQVGRLQTLGAQAASQGIDKSVFMAAVMIQMTWPGAPTIYYADEAGQVGWTDPDNRRTYPWGHEDRELIELHRSLTALRRAHPVLRNGSLLSLGAGSGWIAYARFDDADQVITVCNNAPGALELALPVWRIGAEDGEDYIEALAAGEEGFRQAGDPAGRVRDGSFRLKLPGKTTLVLTRGDR